MGGVNVHNTEERTNCKLCERKKRIYEHLQTNKAYRHKRHLVYTCVFNRNKMSDISK